VKGHARHVCRAKEEAARHVVVVVAGRPHHVSVDPPSCAHSSLLVRNLHHCSFKPKASGFSSLSLIAIFS
jgi:hypothetical protein